MVLSQLGDNWLSAENSAGEGRGVILASGDRLQHVLELDGLLSLLEEIGRDAFAEHDAAVLKHGLLEEVDVLG